MKILYLEDDINLSETVEEFLVDEGFEVTCVYGGDEAIEVIYKQNFDLFILDVNVPSINGFELLKTLRDANIQTPAIFTTSLSGIDDLAKGFDSGGDDYIKKPFLLKELLFRIKALLKREFKTQASLINISDKITFNTQTNELLIDNKQTVFHSKELLLLKLLLKHCNEAVTFENIYQNVWSYDEIHSEMSLRTYIKNLRKHLGKDKILSIKKIGYKLV